MPELAKAYVTIIPAFEKGTQKKITSEVVGEMDKAGGEAGDKSGKSFGGRFGKLVKGAAIAGAAALGTAFMAAGKQAISLYADFEQLSGGVEKLFGSSADAVLQNAQNAFMTAGLSANQYMETVTSFSASLINSLGGDTEKAAKMSDMAIQDMADNANVFGTNIEEIQRTYQSFSRGLFGMLDNLKLGYGGTQAEMERLLADAEAISGIHYDISSYADIVDAIHVIQTEMGITGTTVAEASRTISGSINAAKAAYQNWLTSLADTDADVTITTKNMVNAVGRAVENLIPAIGHAMEGFFSALPTLLTQLSGALVDLINKMIPLLISLTPEFISAGVTLFIGLVQGLNEIIPQILDMLPDLITQITDGIIANAPLLLEAGIQLVVGIVKGIWQAAPQIVSALWDAIKQVPGLIKDLLSKLFGYVKVGFDRIKTFVSSIWEGIKHAITHPIETASNIVKGIIDKIAGFFHIEIHWPHIPLPHFQITPAGWKIADLLKGQLPHLGIEWYASGGVITSPRVVGVGEAGPEAIVPLRGGAMQPFAEAIAEAGAGGNVYNVTIDVRRLKDLATVEDIADVFVAASRAGRTVRA